MVSSTGFEPVILVCKQLKILDLFLPQDSPRHSFVFCSYCGYFNFYLQDRSNYLTRHFYEYNKTLCYLSPYAVFFLTFFAVLAADLNDFAVGEPFDPTLRIFSGLFLLFFNLYFYNFNILFV